MQSLPGATEDRVQSGAHEERNSKYRKGVHLSGVKFVDGIEIGGAIEEDRVGVVASRNRDGSKDFHAGKT